MTAENEAYYRHIENFDCNEELSDRAIVVNCTGRCVLPRHFSTHSRFGRNDFYLLYMQQGRMELEFDGKTSHICPGELIVFPPRREYRYTKACEEPVIYLWAHYTGSAAAELTEGLGLLGGIRSAGLSGSVQERFRELFSEFLRRDACFEAAAHGLLVSILAHLSRRVRAGRGEPAGLCERISASLLHIHQNIEKPLSAAELSELEHLSPSRYRAIFRRCMGCSPGEYIASLRVARACELMEHSGLSVREAAALVGYADPLYFSRLFRKKTGCSPSDFLRERARG